jgi:hypothetical protein
VAPESIVLPSPTTTPSPALIVVPPAITGSIDPPTGPTTGGGSSDGRSTGGGPAPDPGPPPAIATNPDAIDPSAPEDPAAVVRTVIRQVGESVADTVDTVVKPRAAAVVATTFTFPLALMILVVVFLVVQPRVDRMDPKLRAASGTASDTLLGFEEEDAL